MSNGNGNGKHEKRKVEPRRSITIAGPVTDAFGRRHDRVLELFEGDAGWRLVMERVIVQEGGPAPGQLIAMPGDAQQPPRHHALFVPFYEITQGGPDGHLVRWMVPVEQVRSIRIPLTLVEVAGPEGIERHPVPYAMAEEIERRQIANATRPIVEQSEH